MINQGNNDSDGNLAKPAKRKSETDGADRVTRTGRLRFSNFFVHFFTASGRQLASLPTSGQVYELRASKLGRNTHTHVANKSATRPSTCHLRSIFFVLSAAGAGEMKTERPDNKKVSDFPWQRVDYLSWYQSSADYKRRLEREPVGVALHHPAAR